MEFSTSVALSLLLLIAQSVNAAVYFYGATHIEEEKRLPPTSVPLEIGELRTAYNYCQVLPILEARGRVKRNEETRQICQGITDLLVPMFGDARQRRAYVADAE
ncbi:hypothetical protein AAVH_22428 [Aphelenchoides avenae]|nr:hypothetical protein AAVH_22428 [Aphelenchus avenae]